METVLRPIPDEVMFDERSIAFRAILLYEHEEGAEAAKSILARVCARLPDAAIPEISLWHLERLRDNLAARSARSHAVDADLVVVAARGVEPLPTDVKQALETWTLENVAAGFGFLVLLTDVPDGTKTESPVYRYIADLAARINCELCSRGLMSAWGQSRYDDIRTEAGLADQEFMVMSAPTRRWGINE
jgi:hypothetical protein